MAKIQTDKQRKLLKLLSENLGLGKPKTLYDMMLEAGYEESTARQQSLTLRGIREELNPIVARLEKHREKIIARMEKEISKARYRDLTDALDKVTKNIQLLSGGATEHIAAKVVILPGRKSDAGVETESAPGAGS